MKPKKEIIIGVYKITNKNTDKYYIGYSENIYKRFKQHKKTLKKGTHQNIILQRSYNKHTLDAFIFEIIHVYDNIEDAKSKELEYLENLDIRSMLYNINYNSSGGDILSTHPDKENIINKMKQSLNNTMSKMTEDERKEKYGQSGEKNGMYGKTHTDEVKKILSENLTGNTYALGCKRSEEAKKNLSNLAKLKIGEKNPFYGKTHSEETKTKLSEINKGKKNINCSKSITIGDVIYESLTEASKKLNIAVSVISWRIKSKNKKFENYKFTNEEQITKPISNKLSIDNVEYNSVTEVCKKLELTKGYVTRRLNSLDDEDKEWKILDKPRDKRKQKGKKVLIHDIIYESIKEASTKLNIEEAVLTKYLNSKTPIPVSNKKRVSIDNVIYDSVTEASDKLNTNINVVIKRLKSESIKFTSHFYLPVEYVDLEKYKYIL